MIRTLLPLPALAAATLLHAAPIERRVAITIDDLPFVAHRQAHGASGEYARAEAATNGLLAALDRHKAPAIGFVNESKLMVPGEIDRRTALLARWIDAGQSLGNHGYAPPDYHAMPAGRFEDEVVRGDTVLRMLPARGLADDLRNEPDPPTWPYRAHQKLDAAPLSAP